MKDNLRGSFCYAIKNSKKVGVGSFLFLFPFLFKYKLKTLENAYGRLKLQSSLGEQSGNCQITNIIQTLYFSFFHWVGGVQTFMENSKFFFNQIKMVSSSPNSQPILIFSFPKNCVKKNGGAKEAKKSSKTLLTKMITLVGFSLVLFLATNLNQFNLLT